MLRARIELVLQKPRAPHLAVSTESPQTTHKTNHLGLCVTQKCPGKPATALVAKKVVGGWIRGEAQELRLPT